VCVVGLDEEWAQSRGGENTSRTRTESKDLELPSELLLSKYSSTSKSPSSSPLSEPSSSSLSSSESSGSPSSSSSSRSSSSLSEP